MFRSLPPAGHPLSPGCAFSAVTGPNNAPDPLNAFFGKRPYYLCSGTAALTLSLMALKKNGRDKVIIPAYTCPSLLASVLRAGLRPVLCDIEPQGFRMIPGQLESKADSETLGIIAVHLFGIPERMDAIRDTASRIQIAVIEDATQALGGRYRVNGESGICMGAIGDLGVLSFRRGKPVSFLAGGAVLVNNPEFEHRLETLYYSLPAYSFDPALFPYILQLLTFSLFFHPRLYWIPQRLPWLRLGETIFTTDYRMSRLNPRVLRIAPRVWADMDRTGSIRSRLAGAYAERLQRHRDKFLYLPEEGNCPPGLLRYPVVFKEPQARDRAFASLRKKGLGASCLYPAPVNEIPGVPLEFRAEQFPNAKLVSTNILTLPLHEHVRARDVEAIASEINRSL